MTTKKKKRNLSKAKLEEWHLTEHEMYQIGRTIQDEIRSSFYRTSPI
jgi:hypothetical protein